MEELEYFDELFKCNSNSSSTIQSSTRTTTSPKAATENFSTAHPVTSTTPSELDKEKSFHIGSFVGGITLVILVSMGGFIWCEILQSL